MQGFRVSTGLPDRSSAAKGWHAMLNIPRDSRELGTYMALAQVGMEMVAPIGVGWLLDYYFDWSPWGIVGGAVVGFIGGLGHLLSLKNRQDRSSSKPGPEGS